MVLSTVGAFTRGLIRVLFSIAGLVVGLAVASQYYLVVGNYLGTWVHSVETVDLIAFLLLLFGVILVFSTVGAVVRRTVAAVGLGPIDRLLGAVFGFIRGG